MWLRLAETASLFAFSSKRQRTESYFLAGGISVTIWIVLDLCPSIAIVLYIVFCLLVMVLRMN